MGEYLLVFLPPEARRRRCMPCSWPDTVINPISPRRDPTARRYAVFVSEAGHYAAKKSAALLGLGTDAVIAVDADANGAMEVAGLRSAIERVSQRRPGSRWP